MTLSPGVRLGAYEVLALVGTGGMGEVYRARDTKLGRDVAIKILPPAFADDPERLARFQREAQVLAALNHPNIAAIYGLEDAEGLRALVLELVEGPTLADRLVQGPIPLDEALPIARQIAEALEAAHEQRIIHRDLKPSNIKLRPDGTVKVLDFGLAKALEGGGGEGWGEGAPPSQLPTLSVAGTRAGVILGTAAYMSPEQARGKPVDKRTDIWAFGSVLFEMLTGKRAFDGDDVSETLAAVLRGEPAWDALSPLPGGVKTLLRRCLQKDPQRRLRDIGEARIAIDEAVREPSTESFATGPVPQKSRWRRVMPSAAAAVGAAVITGVVIWNVIPQPPQSVVRFAISAPPNARLLTVPWATDIVISPDGARVIYSVQEPDGGSGLYVRPVGELAGARLTGTGWANPFISPDGLWVGFGTPFDRRLKKVSILGGPPVTICEWRSLPYGASWGEDDTIVFGSADPGGGLMRAPAAGGEPQVLTKPGPGMSHRWPDILPGGRGVLFAVASAAPGAAPATSAVALLDLATGGERILIREGTHPRYSATGHIVYAVQGTLRAVRFDLNRLEITGEPVTVLEGVLSKESGAADFSLARNGSLAYVSGTALRDASRTLVWVDRQQRETPINAPPRGYIYPRLSPDGTRVALDIRDQENDIWIWDLARETLTRLTFDPGFDRYPAWTPDGKRVVFARGSVPNLFWQAADGTGSVEQLTEGRNQYDSSVSPDGKLIVFEEGRATNTGFDIMLLSLGGERRARPLIQTTFLDRNPEISPDGRWLAYDSNESGRTEIYVRPFPNVDDGRWQISTGGGTRPLWARSGRELFYLAAPGRLMAVLLQVGPGPIFTAGNPQVIVEGPYVAPSNLTGRTYDVAADGQRFLMIKDSAPAGQTPLQLVVVLNWFEELKRLVPTN